MLAVETVKTKIPEKRRNYRTNKFSKKKQKENKVEYKIFNLIIYVVIIFIIGYVTSDIFLFDTQSENKALIVNQKLDSLKTYLDSEIPKIDNAIYIQKEQLENIKTISSLNK